MEPKPAEKLQSELESFREEWLSEVRAKHPSPDTQQHGVSPRQPVQPSRIGPLKPTTVACGKKLMARRLDDDHDYVQPEAFDAQEHPAATQSHVESANKGQDECKVMEPVSALDHYEAAVEKESQGSLGDSLRLYRKAFRVSYGCQVSSAGV